MRESWSFILAASIEFVDLPYGSVEKISMRLYWKERELFVQTVAR